MKFLIVGFGSIGRRHAVIIKKNWPEFELIVCSQHCDLTSQKEFGIDYLVRTLDEAIEHQPDAAIIANCSVDHITIAKKLLTYNIHMLIEKPVSDDINKIEGFLGQVEDSGLVVQVGYVLRYLDSLNEFRHYILSESLGEMYMVQSYVGQSLTQWRINRSYAESVSAKKATGGGVLLELSHELDYLIWIFGDLALESSRVHKASKLDIDVEDMAELSLASKKKNQAESFPVSLHMNMIQQNPERYCKVIAENGDLIWDGVNQEVILFPSKSYEKKRTIYSEKSYDRDCVFYRQMGFFIKSIEAKTQSLEGLAQAIQVLGLIDRVKAESYDHT